MESVSYRFVYQVVFKFPAVAVKKADSLLLPGTRRLTPPLDGVVSQRTTSAGRGRDFDQVWDVSAESAGLPAPGVNGRETRVSKALSEALAKAPPVAGEVQVP